MIIRDERPGDESAIAAVIARAFATAPHASGAESDIVERLRRAGDLALSLVAGDGERIVGHAAFSPVTIGGVGGEWYGLGPVAVEPARQGEGIGAALIGQGLDRLRKGGAGGCVVLGDPDYYRRFGFEADPGLTYPGVPAEYFQRLVLGGPVVRGTVVYAPAFS